MKTLVRWTMVVLVLTWANGAFALPIVYIANLDGPSEAPPNASPGTGFAEVDFDIVAHTLYVDVTFADLIGTTTASHIHGPASPGTNAGVITTTPTFTGFPLGVTSGTYMHTFDTTLASSFNPAFVTAQGGVAQAEAALAAYLADGTAYLNIHTTFRPGGEIRGFLAQPVPEPCTMLLIGSGLVGVAGLRRRFIR
jgi:hypothetical protein